MMNDYVNRIQEISGATQMDQKCDGYWMESPDLDVVQLARCMKEWGARLSTMTAAVVSENEIHVIYHYYLDRQLYNFTVNMKDNTLPSISTILPAADWIEREIRDLFRVEFSGHPHPERLIQPINMDRGLFREPGGKTSKDRR